MRERSRILVLMNKLTTAKRTAVVAALVEGNSIRATARMTNVSKPTILKFLADLGEACAVYHDAHVRGLKSARIQVGEIWSFVGCKAKNVSEENAGQSWGDCWTWNAIDADSKLIVSYLVGPRTPSMAFALMGDLVTRLAGQVQLTTDGLYWYPHAVERAFGIGVDYAVLKKHYGTDSNASGGRYSPAKYSGSTQEVITGIPDKRHISTSFAERQHLSMRMGMRRYTRLTNAFSKKLENHIAANALDFLHYNFARIHRTLRVTPAMAAGIADHVWGLDEIVAMLDNQVRQTAA
jgi:IS1 family transposase